MYDVDPPTAYVLLAARGYGHRHQVRLIRLLAANRAVDCIDAVLYEQFDALWAAEGEFITVTRAELGLTHLRLDNGRGTG